MDPMWRSLPAATAVVLASFSANGQPRPATPDGNPIPDLVAALAETRSERSGNTIAATWEAFRRAAAARGVQVSVVYDGEILANATGGVRTGGAYLGNLR